MRAEEEDEEDEEDEEEKEGAILKNLRVRSY